MSAEKTQVVAVDIGNAGMSIGWVNALGQPEVIPLSSGRKRVPAAICFEGQNPLVGEVALQMGKILPERLITGIPRRLQENSTVSLDGETYTAPTLFAILLRHLVREAELETGPIQRVVVCTSLPTTLSIRHSIETAGAIAGLEVVAILGESEAALLATLPRRDEEIALLYGLGAGHLEVSLARLDAGRVELLAQNGSRGLGGDDWTERIVQYVREQFQAKWGIDVDGEALNPWPLYWQCETAKRELGTRERIQVPVHLAGQWLEVELRREKFEELTVDLLLQTEFIAEHVLNDAGISWEQVSQVLLVGGASRMPLVHQMLEQKTGRRPDPMRDVELAPILGATVYAREDDQQERILRNDDKVPRTASLCLSVVSAHGIGILAFGEKERRNVVLIPRNSHLPTSVTEKFHILAHSSPQSLELTLTEGDSSDPELVQEIGTIQLPVLSGEGDLELTIELDHHYELNVTVRHSSLGVPVESHLALYAPLKDREIQKGRQTLEEWDSHRGDPALPFAPDKATEPPAIRDDLEKGVDQNVQFTAFRPREIQPDEWYPLLVFAHYDELPADAPSEQLPPIERVRQEAARVLDTKMTEYKETTQDSRAAVPHEAELTFVPQMAGVTFNPPRQSVLWMEGHQRVEFRLRADAQLDNTTARGQITVFQGSIILADIPLQISVSRRAKTERVSNPNTERETARPYRKIFASYSHLDLPIVLQFENLAKALGDRYLRDWIDLRAGEIWSERLGQMIEEADIFQLFWSSHSLPSGFVRQEWEHALALNRRNFIRPTYWEDPLPEKDGLPPEELKRLHFEKLLVVPVEISPKPTEPVRQHIQDQRDQARQELERIAEDLAAAMAEHDIERARKVRQRGEPLMTKERDSLIVQRMLPTLEWLAQIDRYDRAIAKLEQALDKGEDSQALEELYHQALQCGGELPPELEARLMSRLGKSAAYARRTRSFWAIALVILLIVLGSVFALVSAK